MQNRYFDKRSFYLDIFFKVIQIAHLFSAMLFIGWAFAKIFVVTPAKKVIGEVAYQDLQKALAKKVWKIYPPNILFLIVTGTILLFRYVNFENGLFVTPFQTLLIIKGLLAYGIGIKVVYSISKRIVYKNRTMKDPNPVESNAYYYIFATAITIALLAKIMFFV